MIFHCISPGYVNTLLATTQGISQFLRGLLTKYSVDIEVPSLVDGKKRNLARVTDFVSWDEACRVPRHKITHECKIPPLSIHE